MATNPSPPAWNEGPLGEPPPKRDPSTEGLPEWGKTKMKEGTPPAPKGADVKSAKPKRRRRVLKILLILFVVFLVGAGLLIGFAPAIASSLAPGYIEKAAKKEIAGSIKVSSLSITWGGPIKVGPVELFDEKNKS